MILESNQSKPKLCIMGDAEEHQVNSTEEILKHTIEDRFPDSPHQRAHRVPVKMVNRIYPRRVIGVER